MPLVWILPPSFASLSMSTIPSDPMPVLAVIRLGFPKLNQPAGIVVGQGFEQNGVHNAEDGGIGADAERQRDYGQSRESWRLRQHAQPVANVLPKRFHLHSPSRRPISPGRSPALDEGTPQNHRLFPILTRKSGPAARDGEEAAALYCA